MSKNCASSPVAPTILRLFRAVFTPALMFWVFNDPESKLYVSDSDWRVELNLLLLMVATCCLIPVCGRSTAPRGARQSLINHECRSNTAVGTRLQRLENNEGNNDLESQNVEPFEVDGEDNRANVGCVFLRRD